MSALWRSPWRVRYFRVSPEYCGDPAYARGEQTGTDHHVSPDRIARLGNLSDKEVARPVQNERRGVHFVFTGTNRIDGRVTASQIASASAASVLPRLT